MTAFLEPTFSPVLQAFVAGLFTWAITALGAAVVIFTQHFNPKALDAIDGFASGVMIAASFWSLLEPAIELSALQRLPTWFPASVGFLLGGFFLAACDRILPHLHPGMPLERAEGIKARWDRKFLLVLAITLHNIPEGLAIGVAFGAAATGSHEATLASAMILTFGIALQNFPEGAAVSLPLRQEGVGPVKSFAYGQASALVEPLAAAIGAGAVALAKPLLPYALSFAAGAMIFVVIEELIPKSHRERSTDLATVGALIGFVLMMMLDVAFR